MCELWRTLSVNYKRGQRSVRHMIYLCPWILKSKTGVPFKVSLEFECNLSHLTVKPDASFMDPPSPPPYIM